jgi:hypothetical protein
MTHIVAEHLTGWLSCRIQTLAARTKSAAKATTRERFGHTQADTREVLIRTIGRLQHHQAFLAGTTIEPLPEPVRGRLEECLAQVFAETAVFLSAAAPGTMNDSPRPSLGEFTRSIAAYNATLAGLRREGIIDQLPREEAFRVEALTVQLDELREDMETLMLSPVCDRW